jgi:acetyltransferase-like isoleucine patch superfamily enzyme
MMPQFLRKLSIPAVSCGRSFLMALVSLLSIALGPWAGGLQKPLLNIIGIKTKGKVFFGRRVIIYSANLLCLGDRVAIGDNAHIACHDAIQIGDDFLAAPGLYLNSGQHDIRTLEGFGQPIRIGARVWCGVRVTICAGVEIGDDVVIGAGSVVVNSLPSGCVAVGVPAKPIGVVPTRRATPDVNTANKGAKCQ